MAGVIIFFWQTCYGRISNWYCFSIVTYSCFNTNWYCCVSILSFWLVHKDYKCNCTFHLNFSLRIITLSTEKMLSLQPKSFSKLHLSSKNLVGCFDFELLEDVWDIYCYLLYSNLLVYPLFSVSFWFHNGAFPFNLFCETRK